jgi:hypothetical protein
MPDAEPLTAFGWAEDDELRAYLTEGYGDSMDLGEATQILATYPEIPEIHENPEAGEEVAGA